jgi:hypothetical protein
MNYSGIYTVLMEDTSVSGAITLIQLKPVTVTLLLLRAWISQRNLTASAQQRVQILRKSAAATVTSFTPRPYGGSDQAAKSVGGASATGVNASGEGTDGDVLVADAFNILNGWLWVPTPEERITVPAGGFLALKLPAAPGSAMNINAGMVFAEVG